jgi:hypothetical protein
MVSRGVVNKVIERLRAWYRYHFVEWHCQVCGVELPKGQVVCAREECLEEYNWRRMTL